MSALCLREVWVYSLAPSICLAPLGAVEKTIRVKGRAGRSWWGRRFRTDNHSHTHRKSRFSLGSQVPGRCQAPSTLL